MMTCVIYSYTQIFFKSGCSSLCHLHTWDPYQTAQAVCNPRTTVGLWWAVYFFQFLGNYCLSLSSSKKRTRLISISFCYSPPRSLYVFLNPELWQRSESEASGEGSSALWGHALHSCLCRPLTMLTAPYMLTFQSLRNKPHYRKYHC